jgi:predicted metal-dependent phosphoesterase TrpH
MDGIAITDHNSAAWVDQVQMAAKGSGLVVFPGVEISCTGGKKCIHIIGLFDVTKSSEHIKAVLNLISINPDDYGKQDAISKKGPIDVIETICENGGIAVLAHANSSNGVLSDMSGQARINVIQCRKLLAAEGTDFHDDAKAKAKKRAYCH